MKARDFLPGFSRFSKERQAQTGRVLRVGTDVRFTDPSVLLTLGNREHNQCGPHFAG